YRFKQASPYHNLGIVSQKQRQWVQAEQYYQLALRIYIEYNARYEQAGTYHQLGLLAQDQQQWKQACDYLLQASEIFVEFNDEYSLGIALRSIARLWRDSGDASILTTVTEWFGTEVSEAEALLRGALGIGNGGET
ncbi:MAG: tetratricopeptide repeat protein, partial [Ktedonobacteraceae bacterium]